MDFLKNIFSKIISIFFTLLFFCIIISTISFVKDLFSHESSKKKEIKKEVQQLISHHHYWKDNNSRYYSGNVIMMLSIKKIKKRK